MKYLYITLAILMIISLGSEMSGAYYGGYIFPGYYPYLNAVANNVSYNERKQDKGDNDTERTLNGTLPDILPSLEIMSLSPFLGSFSGYPFRLSGY